MNEVTRQWTTGKRRLSFFCRWWGHGNLLRSLWRWLLKGNLAWPFTISANNRHATQHECYCPQGSLSGFRVELFGYGFWGELSRSWTPKPCHCDKVMWLCFPENHAEEIEEYGAERLRAEYPDMEMTTP